MSLLTPEPGLVFWMSIAFGITLFILIKFAFPPILKAVEKRKNYVDESLVAAKKAKEELDHVKEIGESLLADTRKQQTEMIKEASKIQEQMLEDARQRAGLESEKIIGVARKQIQSEKEIALQSIREEVAKLSIDLTEKILREELSTDKEQMKMIDRLLDEIEISSE